MAAILYVVVLQNNSIQDASRSAPRDLATGSPLQLRVSCTSRDSKGNVNPFCPGVSHVPDPTGFQFVPTLGDSGCQQSVMRAPLRSLSQPWLAPDAYTSPSILRVEQALGYSAGLESDPFQITQFTKLARDVSVMPQVRGCTREGYSSVYTGKGGGGCLRI